MEASVNSPASTPAAKSGAGKSSQPNPTSLHRTQANVEDQERFAVLDQRLVRALECIQANIHHPLSVAGIARHAHLSVSRLFHLFRCQIGSSPNHMLMRLRMEAAATLLARTDQRICEVGAAIGMTGPTGFGRAFRAWFGVSPTRYRIIVRAGSRARTAAAHAAEPVNKPLESRRTVGSAQKTVGTADYGT
jgi:AraC-like DNA-binding protein